METHPELARGQTMETLRRLWAGQERGFEALQQTFDKHFERLQDLTLTVLEQVTQISLDVGDVKAEMQALRQWLERNRVPPQSLSSPLRISVVNEHERKQILAIRDRLRSLPTETTTADDWLLLGDGLSAAGLFEPAQESHQQAATIANEAGDTTREAEGLYKQYRDACEQNRSRSLEEVFGEAQTLKRLSHPGVIGVRQWGFVDRKQRKRPYLILDYFQGPRI